MIAHLVFHGEPSFPHESDHRRVVDELAPRGSVLALRAFDLGLTRGSGGASARPFSAVKQLAGSGPILLRAVEEGARYPTVELELRGPNEQSGAEEILATYRFTDVTLGGVAWSGADGAEVASDRIAFSYRGLKLTVDAVEADVQL